MRLGYFILAVLVVSVLVISLFATNRLTRFCLYTPIKVFVVGLCLSALLWAVSGYVFDNAVVKSYFDVEGKALFLYPFFVVFCCSVASYLIFLCKLSFVRRNGLLTFCSFFLFPLLLAHLVVSTQFDASTYFLQTAYYSLAFLIPQLYFYIDFLRRKSKGEWLD